MQELMMPRTCSNAENPFVLVTPGTVSNVTRAIAYDSGGSAFSARCRRFLLIKVISLVLLLFSVKLFTIIAHVSTFTSSIDYKSTAGWDEWVGVVGKFNCLLARSQLQ
jgi:hypothetical protein